MLSKIYSYGICGLDAYPVTIEVDVSPGLPCTIIVGLPDNAVKESKERIRAAIKNSGYRFPAERITINLAPADIRKEGPSFDLAMALGILAATNQIEASRLKDYIILGELALGGQIRPINGALSIARALPRSQFTGIILPGHNAPEAALIDGISIYPVKTLQEVIYFLQHPESLSPFQLDIPSLFKDGNRHTVDFSEVEGQSHAKRGLEIAASGGHNCLLAGPPGSGKTMLARRLPTILPDMTLAEALETTQIHSVMGLIPPGKGFVSTRPFRSPHHTSSDIALIGGGSLPKPGEVTLSHNGVLFLDELPEFDRNVLEALRQPLEDHHVTVARASKSLKFPSRFMLICAMNPCPCGWYTDSHKPCHCTPQKIERYLSKISGPLLDRIDIHLEVPSLKSSEMFSRRPQETSAQIKHRTVQARCIQQERFKTGAIFCNAQMTHQQIKIHCLLNPAAQSLLTSAIEELRLSTRAHDKILKVSRTIADLDGETDILPEHIAEAVQYRNLDRTWM